MGSENVSFEAVGIATVGVVVGIAYLLGAMLSLLSDGGSNVLVLADSVAVTTTAGVLSLLTAGFLGTGHRYGRYLGVLTYASVAIAAAPSLASPTAPATAQAALASLVTLYLTVRNPVPVRERSNIDESTSASKLGSTIR